MTGMAIRPLEAADRAALAASFARLSPESRRRRFLTAKPQLSARELTYLTDIDHLTHEALAAVDPRGHIVAVARYVAWPSECLEEADVAMAVIDEFQRRGIGAALAERLIERARTNSFVRLTASTLWENAPARALLARLGFRATGGEAGVVLYGLELAASTSGSWRREETSSLRNA